jgi:hypothetical protein
MIWFMNSPDETISLNNLLGITLNLSLPAHKGPSSNVFVRLGVLRVTQTNTEKFRPTPTLTKFEIFLIPVSPRFCSAYLLTNVVTEG